MYQGNAENTRLIRAAPVPDVRKGASGEIGAAG
jgi:hypothetical protein